ncbi:MAG: HAD family hydrolase [Candidatus Thorarchaeota archaeon]
MLRCIVFDLDGTIIKLTLPLEAMRNDTKAYFLAKGLPSELLEPADGISSSTAKAKGYFLSEGLPISEWNDMTSEVDIVLSKHEKHSASEVTLIDNALETVKHLRTLDLKTAILTNNGRHAVDIILDNISMSDYFDIIQTRHESPNPKPAPDGILSIVELLGMKPTEVVYVGDALIDGTAATRAGVEFWGVTTGETNEEGLLKAGASIVVDHISKLIPIVKERQNR